MSTHYQKQLQYIFDRPVTKPEWFWSIEEDPGQVFEQDPLSAFIFIETFLSRPGEALRPFSDDQVAIGLDFIFNNSCSNLTHDFKEADVPADRRVNALKSLVNLFREVYEPRCAPQLSAGAQESISLINGNCYMFWDVTPLSDWLEPAPDTMPQPGPEILDKLMALDPNSEDFLEQMTALMPMPTPEQQEEMLASVERQYQSIPPGAQAYYHAIVGGMEQCLLLRNPACVESALHGLGHLAVFQPELARPVIDRFLKREKTLHPQLAAYAKSARTGRIL